MISSVAWLRTMPNSRQVRSCVDSCSARTISDRSSHSVSVTRTSAPATPLYGPRLKFGSYLQRDSLLPPKTCELVIMRTAWLTRTEYEWGHHVESARKAGLSDAEIQRIAPNGGPRGQAMLGYMLGRGGRTAEARQVLDSLLERSRRTNGGAFDVAIVYAGLGDKDQAFAWLNKAVDDRSLGFEWMYTIVNGLRPDPRFEKLQHRIGLNGSAN